MTEVGAVCNVAYVQALAKPLSPTGKATDSLYPIGRRPNLLELSGSYSGGGHYSELRLAPPLSHMRKIVDIRKADEYIVGPTI